MFNRTLNHCWFDLQKIEDHKNHIPKIYCWNLQNRFKSVFRYSLTNPKYELVIHDRPLFGVYCSCLLVEKGTWNIVFKHNYSDSPRYFFYSEK